MFQFRFWKSNFGFCLCVQLCKGQNGCKTQQAVNTVEKMTFYFELGKWKPTQCGPLHLERPELQLAFHPIATWHLSALFPLSTCHFFPSIQCCWIVKIYWKLQPDSTSVLKPKDVFLLSLSQCSSYPDFFLGGWLSRASERCSSCLILISCLRVHHSSLLLIRSPKFPQTRWLRMRILIDKIVSSNYFGDQYTDVSLCFDRAMQKES